MKKLFILMTVLAVGLASCTNDPADTPAKEKLGLTIAFDKPHHPFVTRATIATDAEWNVKTLDVYVAIAEQGQGDQEMGQMSKLRLGNGDQTLEADEDYLINDDFDEISSQKYTITMAEDWLTANSGKDVTFYFVANANSSMKGAPDLSSASEATFKQALTKALVVTDGQMEDIEHPDGETPGNSTKNLLFSDVVGPVTISSNTSVRGQLERAVARFDIENPEAQGDHDDIPGDESKGAFVITRILVSNAAQKGYVFGNANATNWATDVELHDLVELPGLSASDYTELGSTNLTEETVAPAVFYLYPTKLGDDPATETQIYILGRQGDNGVEQVLPIVADKDIKRNNRYILRVNTTKMSIDLISQDYDTGEILPAAPGSRVNDEAPSVDYTGTLGAAFELANANAADFESTDLAFTWTIDQGTAVADGEFVIDVTSKFGTAYILSGDADGLIAVTKTAMYDRATKETTDQYRFVITDTDEALDATFQLIGWDDDNGKKTISIVRAAN